MTWQQEIDIAVDQERQRADDAERRFYEAKERADEAERKFKGFDGIENTPAFKAMQSILRKSGMAR